MAAPMLSKAQTNTSLRTKASKKQKKTKPVLTDTFEVVWPKVDVAIEEKILQKLKSTIEPLGIAKIPCGRNSRQLSDGAAGNNALNNQKINKEVRDQLLIGVNQVTKGLERDIVRLVLTCPSAQPPILTQHLIGLSAARGCPAINITGLSQLLSSLMNLKSAIAVGFKKCPDGSVFDEVVKYICKYTPTPQLPWIVKIPAKSPDVSDQNVDQKEYSEKDVVNKPVNSKVDKEQGNETLGAKTEENTSRDCGPALQKPDYSRFYVYKNTTKESATVIVPQDITSKVVSISIKTNEGDQFSVATNREEAGESAGEKKKARKRKLSKTMSFVDYQSANILRVPPNENRKEKVKKKKKLKKVEK